MLIIFHSLYSNLCLSPENLWQMSSMKGFIIKISRPFFLKSLFLQFADRVMPIIYGMKQGLYWWWLIDDWENLIIKKFLFYEYTPPNPYWLVILITHIFSFTLLIVKWEETIWPILTYVGRLSIQPYIL